MEKSYTARVYEALKRTNYFDTEKKDSLEVFEKAIHLEDVIIRVERNCNVDKLLFRYNPRSHKFHRITLTEEDEQLMAKEKRYRFHPECKKRKCNAEAIDVDSFIELLEFVFEPIAVYNA